MRKKSLGVVAFAALVLLSGCSYDSTLTVYPEVEQIDAEGDGEYRVEVTATLDGDVETTY